MMHIEMSYRSLQTYNSRTAVSQLSGGMKVILVDTKQCLTLRSHVLFVVGDLRGRKFFRRRCQLR